MHRSLPLRQDGVKIQCRFFGGLAPGRTSKLTDMNLNVSSLPSRDQMVKAFISRDATYLGVFFTGVRSTGIFCRVGCPAKTPGITQLEFFASSNEALLAGFRACKRCKPTELVGAPPEWMNALLEAVDKEPEARWTDADVRALQVDPERLRRWFQHHHGMTFHAYTRARRLGLALTDIRAGSQVLNAALNHGYDSLSGFNEAFRSTFGANPTTAQSSKVMHTARLQTPLGPMVACATDEALCILEFANRPMLATQIKRVRLHLKCLFVPTANEVIRAAADELEAYFGGRLKRFNVPLLTPGSSFQQSVWSALTQIPYGETRSYTEIARQVGRREAVRAVARANGDNRIAIMIPCHRVIGSDGNLTGYGGGLWRKKRLIELETR
jgi:AraC family transcriptional regulator, regulatory protein of adaptative response / methylated-DNA-[protein]-cysteine methyltransferase